MTKYVSIGLSLFQKYASLRVRRMRKENCRIFIMDTRGQLFGWLGFFPCPRTKLPNSSTYTWTSISGTPNKGRFTHSSREWSSSWILIFCSFPALGSATMQWEQRPELMSLSQSMNLPSFYYTECLGTMMISIGWRLVLFLRNGCHYAHALKG